MASITRVNECPYAPGSNRAERFQLFKVGMDEASHQAAGGRGKDWRKAVESGAIEVDGVAVAVGRAPRSSTPRAPRATVEAGGAATEQGLAPEAPTRAAIPPTIVSLPAGLLPGRIKVKTCGYRKSRRAGGNWDDHIVTCTDEDGDRWYSYVSSEGLADLLKEKSLKYGIIESQWKRDTR